MTWRKDDNHYDKNDDDANHGANQLQMGALHSLAFVSIQTLFVIWTEPKDLHQKLLLLARCGFPLIAFAHICKARQKSFTKSHVLFSLSLQPDEDKYCSFFSALFLFEFKSAAECVMLQNNNNYPDTNLGNIFFRFLES